MAAAEPTDEAELFSCPSIEDEKGLESKIS